MSNEPKVLRVWKLGSLEHNLFPTEQAISKLETIISKWDKSSTLDLIWGPDIEVLQFSLDGKDLPDIVIKDVENNEETKKEQ